jgi:hypothetical protein
MPRSGDLLEERIDVSRFTDCERDSDPALLCRRCPSRVHPRNDLFVVKSQPVAARKLDLHMRAVRLRNVEP